MGGGGDRKYATEKGSLQRDSEMLMATRPESAIKSLQEEKCIPPCSAGFQVDVSV